MKWTGIILMLVLVASLVYAQDSGIAMPSTPQEMEQPLLSLQQQIGLALEFIIGGLGVILKGLVWMFNATSGNFIQFGIVLLAVALLVHIAGGTMRKWLPLIMGILAGLFIVVGILLIVGGR